MAKIGLLKPKYAKITVTENDGAETESYGVVKVFAKAVTATSSINTSKAKLYADDGVAEMVDEFSDGQLTFVADDIEDSVEADVTGATVDEENGNMIVNKDTDSPQYVRFGFVVRRQKSGKVQYRAVIFPKVMFSTPNDDYETKGESASLKTTSLTAEIMRNAKHEWRIRSAWLGTEAEAENFLVAQLSPQE